MTVIAQDDHLTAGAWAACGQYSRRLAGLQIRLCCVHMASDSVETKLHFILLEVLSFVAIDEVRKHCCQWWPTQMQIG